MTERRGLSMRENDKRGVAGLQLRISAAVSLPELQTEVRDNWKGTGLGVGSQEQAVLSLYTEPAAGCDLPAPASECSENSGASGTLDCSDAQKVEGRPGEVKWRKEIGHRINRRQRTRLLMNTSDLSFCDFPPLYLGGVGLLMEYLLGNYPPDRLIILTGSRCATAGLNGGMTRGAPPERLTNY